MLTGASEHESVAPPSAFAEAGRRIVPAATPAVPTQPTAGEGAATNAPPNPPMGATASVAFRLWIDLPREKKYNPAKTQAHAAQMIRDGALGE